MNNSFYIDEKCIHGKSIYLFEHHNIAPMAWFYIKKKISTIPSVLTFDYHTDAFLAFNDYISRKLSNNSHNDTTYEQKIDIARKKCCKIKNENDIKEIITDLKNDEHIDFAIRAKIISHAYIISHSTYGQYVIKPIEKKEKIGIIKYELPENKIIELDNEHVESLSIKNYEDLNRYCISNENLLRRLEKIEQINKSIFGGAYDFLNNFILDIDLDYFNTHASLEPSNISVFYNLIRKSQAITIAQESEYVHFLKIDDGITSNYILAKLFEHFEKALNEFH
jgi:hypothetical protein